MSQSRRGFLASAGVAAASQRRRSGPPNIVLVITDDQGYGDLACHGNPVIRTPHLDRLHAESVRFTDFHSDPLCAPTRAGLLTGRYAYRGGVTAAFAGRSILRRDEVTMAELLRAAGYRCGLFGKWHLGDNYPYRPNERGFDETVACWSGGVTQAADYWGNDYFDDTYCRNLRPEKFRGYCTDVFFTEGIRFMEQNRNRPFFLFLPTNAPHAPYLVAERYSAPYRQQGLAPTIAAFYGMITNLDENVGRLRRRIAGLGLENDTILIFMTDNGSAAGSGPAAEGGTFPGFTAGMRMRKASNYDGGHRVPFFLRWPGGGIAGGRDVHHLAAHIDVLPTLLELAGIGNPRQIAFDGASLAPLLQGKPGFPENRTHFIQHQQFRVDGEFQMENPKPWLNSAVLTRRWRLVNGTELYDIGADPGQSRDIAGSHPEVVKRLRGSYEQWWGDVTRRFDEYLEITVGSPPESPSRLTCFDWHGGLGPPNQEAIRKAPWTNGFWAIEVAQGGRYEVVLRQQPPEADFPIEGRTARLKIGEVDVSKPVPEKARAVPFAVVLPPGKTKMQTWFTAADGRSRGAYYAYLRYLGPANR